jgi:D-tyrosyl-tRNA(Tyr) deacylase
MRIVVQRVLKASVTVEGSVIGEIEKGALVLLGIHKDDAPEQTPWLVNKLSNLRMFKDADDKMNLSLLDIGGSVLVVSQFTLYANCESGRRPDFIDAAHPSKAKDLYDKFIGELRRDIPSVATGSFGADMQVSLVNDGPVTFVIDAKV